MDPKQAHTIADQLKDEIIAGQLQPGTRLHQENLAAHFGVSRQPVRAALEVLTALELAEQRTDRSVVVAGIPDDTAEEIIAIRQLLEPEALARAFDHLTPRDLLAARHAMEQFDVETDAIRLARHDLEFHMALYGPCKNNSLLALVRKLRMTSIRAYTGQPLGSALREACSDAHHALYQACLLGRRTEALNLLSAHFDLGRGRPV